MKLKVFNKENSTMLVSGEPLVRISVKAGLFSFSKDAGVLLGLNNGNKIEFVQDEETKIDWFISITDSKDGFSCRSDGQKFPRFDFNSRGLTKAILDSIKFKGTGVSFKIQENPVELEGSKYYLILTSKLINPTPTVNAK